MSEILAGLGIALVLEGLLWALAPDFARRMLAEMAALPNGKLQPAAVAMAAAGVFIVWLAKV